MTMWENMEAGKAYRSALTALPDDFKFEANEPLQSDICVLRVLGYSGTKPTNVTGPTPILPRSIAWLQAQDKDTEIWQLVTTCDEHKAVELETGTLPEGKLNEKIRVGFDLSAEQAMLTIKGTNPEQLRKLAASLVELVGNSSHRVRTIQQLSQFDADLLPAITPELVNQALLSARPVDKLGLLCRQNKPSFDPFEL